MQRPAPPPAPSFGCKMILKARHMQSCSWRQLLQMHCTANTWCCAAQPANRVTIISGSRKLCPSLGYCCGSYTTQLMFKVNAHSHHLLQLPVPSWPRVQCSTAWDIVEELLTIISGCRRLRPSLHCSCGCSCGWPILQAQQVHQSWCRDRRGHRLTPSGSRQGRHRSGGPASRSGGLGCRRGLAARICSVCGPVSASCHWRGTCSSGRQLLPGVADAAASVRCGWSWVRHVSSKNTDKLSTAEPEAAGNLSTASPLPKCDSPELAHVVFKLPLRAHWRTQANPSEAYLHQRPPQTAS